jgi:Uma2 family endonuclease
VATRAIPDLDPLPRTVEEFRAWVEDRPERWEFVGGEPVMMSPERNRHAIIKSNVGRALGNRLDGGPCRAIVDGPEIVTEHAVAIPDVVVTCAPLEMEATAVPEPVVLVEVDSPSTPRSHVLRKWMGYQTIASLHHFLEIAQDRRLVVHHERIGEDLWRERFVRVGTILLEPPGVELALDEIYDGTGL